MVAVDKRKREEKKITKVVSTHMDIYRSDLGQYSSRRLAT